MEKGKAIKKSKFYCGRCSVEYTRKEQWVKHYDLENVKDSDGCTVPNICFNQDNSLPKICHNDNVEAKNLYKSAIKGKSWFAEAHSNVETDTNPSNVVDPNTLEISLRSPPPTTSLNEILRDFLLILSLIHESFNLPLFLC